MAVSLVKTRKKPTQARAVARIDAILVAAKALLKALSPQDITTTAVARTAGIPVGSVYRYFKDKNDILEQIYAAASRDIINQMDASLAELDPRGGFEKTVRILLEAFWQASRAHPTFKPLTRWANREYSFIDVTPAEGSGLAEIIARALLITGVKIPAARREAAMQTTITMVSALIDNAFEEEDENKAQALIDELALSLTRYLK